MSNSKSAGIYSITSKVNGKRYIGSSIRICDRWKEHLTDLKNNKHKNNHLQNHYNKYSEEDLLFAVIEVIERGELSLQEFKNLLLKREQVYLDNWEECNFNIQKTAASPLGYKYDDSKYYYFNKERNKYKVAYKVFGKVVGLGYFNTEEDAQKQVEFIKTLTDHEILKYHEINYKGNGGLKVGQIPKNSKGYSYIKDNKKWRVYFSVDGYRKHFGYYNTEEEAKQKIKEVREQSANI